MSFQELENIQISDEQSVLNAFKEIVEKKGRSHKIYGGVNVYTEEMEGFRLVSVIPTEAFPLFHKLRGENPKAIFGYTVTVSEDPQIRVCCFGLDEIKVSQSLA